MNKYINITTFLFIFIWALPCKGQDKDDVFVIRSFLNEVLIGSDYSATEIADKYIYFQPTSDSLSKEQLAERWQYFKKELKEIRRKYFMSYDSIDTPIISYRNLKPSLQIPFDAKILNSIYGIIFREDKIMYFWLKNRRISAFDLYMQKGVGKGARAYFITY